MKPTTAPALTLLALLVATTAQAAPVTEPLFGEVTFGPHLGATASGSFTYDDTLVTGVGSETIRVPELSLTLDFLGQTFDESDDIDFFNVDPYPSLTFEDGTPVAINFLVINGDGVGQEILDPEVTGFSMITDLTPVAGGGYFGQITTFGVPEPTSALLATLGGLACVLRRSR